MMQGRGQIGIGLGANIVTSIPKRDADLYR